MSSTLELDTGKQDSQKQDQLDAQTNQNNYESQDDNLQQDIQNQLNPNELENLNLNDETEQSSNFNQKPITKYEEIKPSNYAKHPFSHPNGGYHLNKEIEPISNNAINKLLSNIAKKIINGNFDLLNVCKPAEMTYHMTFIESQAYECINTEYLDAAAENNNNPAERMKNILCFLVSDLHINVHKLKQKTPLNNYMGETLCFEKSQGKTKFYAEQIGVKPPCVQKLIYSDKYKLQSQGQLYVGMKSINSVQGYNSREQNRIVFSNGDIIKYATGKVNISGILKGDRILNYVSSIRAYDDANKIMGIISFGATQQQPQQNSGYLAKLGAYYYQTPKTPKSTDPEFLNDYLTIKVVRATSTSTQQEIDNAEVLAQGDGSWLHYIQIDGKVYWYYGQPQEQWVQTQTELLQSDCMYNRQEKFLLEHQQYQQAQFIIDQLEKQDQTDATLRKKSQSTQKKSFYFF